MNDYVFSVMLGIAVAGLIVIGSSIANGVSKDEFAEHCDQYGQIYIRDVPYICHRKETK